MHNLNLKEQPYQRRGRNGNRTYKEGSLGNIFIMFLIFCLMALFGYRGYRNYMFNIDCQKHLKRAADAFTIDLAAQEMETVISYLKKNNLTTGYTSVFINDPAEQLDFWYQNLVNSLEDIKKLDSSVDQNTVSNSLSRLRETILDEGQTLTVTVPAGISIYPYNKIIAYANIFLVISIAFVLMFKKNLILSNILKTEFMILLAIFGILAGLAFFR